MDSSGNGRAGAILCLVGVALVWGSIPVFLKYFTAYLDPWTVNGVRYAVGALFWLPFALVLSRRLARQARRPPGSVWRAALVPAGVNVLGQVGYAVSPYYVEASVIGFALRASFVFTLAFGFLFIAEERLLTRRPAFWSGVALCLGGVVLMFVNKLLDGGQASVVGMLILLGTTIAWGGYAVSVRRWMAPYPIRLSFGVISLYTSSVLIVLMLLAPNVPPHPVAEAAPGTGVLWRAEALGGLSARLWGLVVGSALLGIALGHVLYYRGIHRLGPVVSSGMVLAAPFFTYLLASATLDEQLSGVQWLGGVSVVAGGVLLLRARAQIEEEMGREAASQPS